MEKLFRFQSLMESLTDEEYNKVSTNIAQNRSLFTGILFNHFNYKLQHTDTEPLKSIDIMNQQLNDIIISRTNIDADIESICTLHHHKHLFADLPMNCMPNISSFLSFSDYIQFEKCNKEIFNSLRRNLSTISHLRLNKKQMLNYIEMIKHNKSFTTRHLFKMVKYIEIRLTDLTLEFRRIRHHSSQTPMISDKRMYFPGTFQLKFQCGHLQNMIKFQFLEEHILKHIYCEVQWLYISRAMFRDLDPMSNILITLDYLQHLKGLFLEDTNSDALLHKLRHQLQSLHLGREMSLNLPALPNLKELCLVYDVDELHQYQTFTVCDKLERIDIDLIEYNQTLAEQDFEFLKELLGLNSVNVICLTIPVPECPLPRIMELLRKVLLNSTRMKQGALAIKLITFGFLDANNDNKEQGDDETVSSKVIVPLLDLISNAQREVTSFEFEFKISEETNAKFQEAIDSLNIYPLNIQWYERNLVGRNIYVKMVVLGKKSNGIYKDNLGCHCYQYFN